MAPIQRIIVATDFSDLAETVIDHAVDLAKQLGASLTLVHAYEIPIYGFPDGVLVAPAELASRLGTSAQEALDALVLRYGSRGVTVTSILRMGAAWDEINAVAEETNADLVVVGTHGRRGLARALLGSTAERLIRTATRPVFVVHAATPAKT